MKKFNSSNPHGALTLFFIITIFMVLTLTMLVITFVFLLLVNAGVFKGINYPAFVFPIIMISVSSVILGGIIAAVLGKVYLKPFNRLSYGLNKLSRGEYSTRISLGSLRYSKSLEKSFNALANELENTEILRSDFINNFSHEFKTPIVSISGFAKLLQKEDLPEEKRKEYLKIIADESTRLADMAAKVLDITKLENQSILTDIRDCNLSEQIRTSLLLLEKKWTAKAIEINADFPEYNIEANEELLKQVWINLIENAIKFAFDKSEVSIKIELDDTSYSVSIKNYGEPILEADKERIFKKFYQSDSSHSTEGNGIGLAIVKKIVELHNGSIILNAEGNKTIFTVVLPISQTSLNRKKGKK